ncbi:hypothetical protein NMYAN_210031 [Nitrosomonas nitrosa]|uniref:Uncharacterized protein n=1 Tax=Nitrosomonas nitrosa TaxID=52442 RepID=A0A8H9D9H5_9PROT|nr:hypothetical protein NMYAN_210031 [Nitrosomonas nitrosa]
MKQHEFWAQKKISRTDAAIREVALLNAYSAVSTKRHPLAPLALDA